MMKRDVCKVLVLMVCMEVVCCKLPSQQVSAITTVFDIIQNDTGRSFGTNYAPLKVHRFEWTKNSNPCLWGGVYCNPDYSSIINVSLTFSEFDISTSKFLPFLCNITTLESVVVSWNHLSSIPDSFLGGCGNMKHLDFSGNRLDGGMPSLNGFKMLKYLDFSRNSLTGEISDELDGLVSLKFLDLSRNRFRGRIPKTLGKLTALEELVVDENSFTGSIPGELADLTRLRRLDLSSNQLSDAIPRGISNITTLRVFEAYENQLNGSIPSGITSHLISLSLHSNKLTGRIASDLLSAPYLESLDLSLNELEGAIPAINSTTLNFLNLGNNDLNGTIPWDSLGRVLTLKRLYLSNNRLTGTLPPVLGNLTNLHYLWLDWNDFVGAIPPEISHLNLLESLNIFDNSLNGSIPCSISTMQSLREYGLGGNNLSSNLFSGPIPVTLSRLVRLGILDLSNNRFSGEIPDFLTRLSSLIHLLLINNNLSGVVPTFRKDVQVDTWGNQYLIDPTQNPTPALPHRKKKSIHPDFFIAAATGFPVGVLISLMAIFISRRYHTIHGILSTPNTVHKPIIHFNKAMQAVSDPSNITVKATFSTFYKAIMPSGTTYLVKKFNHTNKIFQFPRHKELVEELEVLGELSNSNVMIPVAYRLTTRRAYLFYDFVRGTLHDILHHRMGCRLDWASRFTIAVGVTQGLAFLHECSSGPIILLDLCSKSILFKSRDEPQISDIELCSLMHPKMRRDTMSVVAGSRGYVPPEYGSTKRATAAGNVYSLGVVLLELITGKPAVSDDGTELAKWVSSISEQGNRWDEILDSSVSETSVGVRNQMLAVLKVALACVSISPEGRPNTITLLQILLNRRLHN